MLRWVLVSMRGLHILAGTIWAGAAILIAAYVLPAARASGPAGTAVLRQLTVTRRLPQTLLVLAALTSLSGIYLLWVTSSGFHTAWFASRSGLAFSLGGTAALVAFLIGAAINIPTATRIGTLAREAQATGAEANPAHNETLKRLSGRLLWGTRAVAILVALATATMGIARYLE